jgi:hypothetical protein
LNNKGVLDSIEFDRKRKSTETFQGDIYRIQKLFDLEHGAKKTNKKRPSSKLERY